MHIVEYRYQLDVNVTERSRYYGSSLILKAGASWQG